VGPGERTAVGWREGEMVPVDGVNPQVGLRNEADANGLQTGGDPLDDEAGYGGWRPSR
jgi:hypothetical protein